LDELSKNIGTQCYADVHLRALHPMGESRDAESICATRRTPLPIALPDLERRDLIVMGGSFEGREYVAMMGHYRCTFRRHWLTNSAIG
jgi:hypothetical protein